MSLIDHFAQRKRNWEAETSLAKKLADLGDCYRQAYPSPSYMFSFFGLFGTGRHTNQIPAAMLSRLRMTNDEIDGDLYALRSAAAILNALPNHNGKLAAYLIETISEHTLKGELAPLHDTIVKAVEALPEDDSSFQHRFSDAINQVAEGRLNLLLNATAHEVPIERNLPFARLTMAQRLANVGHGYLAKYPTRSGFFQLCNRHTHQLEAKMLLKLGTLNDDEVQNRARQILSGLKNGELKTGILEALGQPGAPMELEHVFNM